MRANDDDDDDGWKLAKRNDGLAIRSHDAMTSWAGSRRAGAKNAPAHSRGPDMTWGVGSSWRYAFVVESQPDHRQRERYQAEEDEDDDCVQERYPRSSGGRSGVGIVPRAAAARRGRRRRPAPCPRS